MQTYQALHSRHFGRGRYDFGENTLNGFGYNLISSGDTTAALRVFELNCEKFPESANTWDSFAEAHMLLGNNDQAIKNYRKSLELNPNNENAKQMLQKLEN